MVQHAAADGCGTNLSYYYTLLTSGVGKPQTTLPFPNNGVGKMWQCPAAKSSPLDSFAKGGRFGMFSYVMNIDLKASGPVGNTIPRLTYPMMPKLSRVPQPSQTVLITEAAFSPTLENYLSDPDRNGIFPCARSYRFPIRHKMGGNVAFLDSHANFFKRTSITNGAPDDKNTDRIERDTPDVIWDIYRN